jgi:hypothetical protein
MALLPYFVDVLQPHLLDLSRIRFASPLLFYCLRSVDCTQHTAQFIPVYNIMYLDVVISEDCTLSLSTQEGADAFIRLGRPYIQTNIEQEVKPAREKLESGNLNKRQCKEMKEVIEKAYDIICYVANFCSMEVFCLVDKSQGECLILHACDVFSKITKDEKWTKTGVLQKHDLQFLDRALMSSMLHISFVKLCIAMEKDADLLAVLAKFYAARGKPNMPCADVTEAMLKIVINCHGALSNDGWEQEKIFKKLESTGILGQVFRCYTLPSTRPNDIQNNFSVLDAVMQCSVLVKRKLKPGQPTGDILAAVIAGKDGYTRSRNQAVMNRLQNLQKMCSMSNEKVGALSPGGKELGRTTCRKCNKRSITSEFGSSHLVCRYVPWRLLVPRILDDTLLLSHSLCATFSVFTFLTNTYT